MITALTASTIFKFVVSSGGHLTPSGGYSTSQGMWRWLGVIFTPKFPPNPFFKILIMHSNTVALDSLLPILLTFSDLLLEEDDLFVLSMKFSVPYVLLIFPLNETVKLPFCLLANWGEKSLTCQIPEGEGGSACLHLLVSVAESETMWSKTVSPLTFKVCASLVDMIRCG